MHSPGKRNTQKIARKPLTLRTRITRLVRKTICFSKSTQMHDIVIGLFVNRSAYCWSQGAISTSRTLPIYRPRVSCRTKRASGNPPLSD